VVFISETIEKSRYANVLEGAIQAGHSVLPGTADTGMLAMRRQLVRRVVQCRN
jgi:hypothetical protein